MNKFSIKTTYDKCTCCGEKFISPAKNSLCGTCWRLPADKRIEKQWEKQEDENKLFNKSLS
jgi:hypothetical protein